MTWKKDKLNIRNGLIYSKNLKEGYSTLLDLMRNTDFTNRTTEISPTWNGHQEQYPYPFLAILTIGIENSTFVIRIYLDSLLSPWKQLTDSQSSGTVISTKSKSKHQMELNMIRTQLGLNIQSKILKLLCSTEFSGTHRLNMNGNVLNLWLLTNKMKVWVYMKHTLEWLKRTVKSVLIESLLWTT